MLFPIAFCNSPFLHFLSHTFTLFTFNSYLLCVWMDGVGGWISGWGKVYVGHLTVLKI